MLEVVDSGSQHLALYETEQGNVQQYFGENVVEAARQAMVAKGHADNAAGFVDDAEAAAGDAAAAELAAEAAAIVAALAATNYRVSIGYKTYSELAAISGSAGQTAAVFGPDTGTHTDPVVGGTVNNIGIYRYSTSPAGWEWLATLHRGVVTTADFGAGTTDNDTTAFLTFLAFCDGTGVEGVIGDINIDDVEYAASGDMNLRGAGLITNRLGDTLANELIRLTGTGANKLFAKNLRINVNGGAFSGFNPYNWLHAETDCIEGWAITCTPASTNSTSMVQVDGCVTSITRLGDIHTMDKGTNTQGSLPRAYSVTNVGGLRNDAKVHGGFIRDAHGGFVIGNLNGGTVDIYGTGAKDLVDNFVYNVGDAGRVTAHNPAVENADEPFVNTGSGVLEQRGGTQIGCTNANGLGGSGGTLRFVGVRFEPATNAQIVRLRPDNVASSALEFYGCSGVCRSEYAPFALSEGALDKFVDEYNDWTIEFDSSVSLDSYMMNFTSGNEVQSVGSKWRLKDINGDIPSGARFINLPTGLTRLSCWHSELVNETANDAAYIRLNNARQQVMTFSGMRSINGIQAEVELNYGALNTAPPRVADGDGPPTTGYWPLRSRIYNTNPASWGIDHWVCTAAGSPGTWKAVPIMEVLSGSTGHTFPIVAAGGVSAEKDLTVTGIVIGDLVLSVGFSVGLPAHASLHWRIKTTNVLSIWLKNDAGVSTSEITGTLRGRVARA